MKNSIEEDIKNAEHFIKSIKTDKEYKEENGWHGYYNKEIVELARILEHILSDYKRVLKENEELRNKLDNSRKANEFLNKKDDEIRREKSLMYSKAVNDIIKGWNLGDDFVPVQKIKYKIEELNKTINKGGIIYSLKQYARCQKDVLEELLESEEE